MKTKLFSILPKEAKTNPKKPLSIGLEKFLEKHSKPVILLLCLMACLRLAIFIGAFPLFNNVDEQAHYDLVEKYSRGHVPKKIEKFDHNASTTIVLYGSPEYLNGPETFPEGEIPPPLWSFPFRYTDANFQQYIQELTDHVSETPNHESTQPPLYYAIAGGWYRLGQVFGLETGLGAYWIRFLNVLVYGLLVWSAYAFTRKLFPDKPFLKFAVPLVLAFLPQDIFYGINNDILSASFFMAAFYFMMRLYLSETRSYGCYLLAGLLAAATFLVKLSNVAILGALGVLVILQISRVSRAGRMRQEFPKIIAMVAATLLPISAWFLRNYLVLGDFTGSSGKISHLGWTLKPFWEIWSHPIFSFRGMATFWHGLMASFWRGEITWHLQPLAFSSFDWFYSISSLLFVSAAGVLICRRGYYDHDTRIIGFMSLLAIGLSVAFLLVISVSYDFHQCFSPSRSHPYITSGRLILGPLVLFMVVYIMGFEYCLSKLGLLRFRLVILVIIVLLITASEIALSYQVFQSPYNLFHIV